MDNLEQFINNDELSDLDALVKMAIIYHQFESIHPFYDGNGRTGRIINILYLVKQDLLDLPILYLSRYINLNKQNYYQLLQKVRDNGNWEDWILFILDGIENVSRQTILLLEDIKYEMHNYKHELRSKLPKIYSQDLLNNLFRHPYTKIEFISTELAVSRQTASKYLDEIEKIGLVTKTKLGKENYYINSALYKILTNVNT